MPPVSDYLSPRFIALAHRGGALYAPNLGIENTLRAFHNAWTLGISYMETDVHATSDGVLLAFHDPDVSRMTGSDGKIRTMSFDASRELLVYGQEPIPTMDELFEALPQARFNIDIKDDAAVVPLARCIERHKAHGRVCVGSFSGTRLSRFKRLLPHITTALSPVHAAGLAIRRGRLPRSGSNVVFQVPMNYRVGPVTVPLVTPQSIAAIHKVGRHIHVWTINDMETMHQLIEWGVDGIVTDRPDLLIAVLKARGMWSAS